MLVAVGNGPQYGGGKRITHGAAMDDGRFPVTVVGPVEPAGRSPGWRRRCRTAGHIGHPAVTSSTRPQRPARAPRHPRLRRRRAARATCRSTHRVRPRRAARAGARRLSGRRTGRGGQTLDYGPTTLEAWRRRASGTPRRAPPGRRTRRWPTSAPSYPFDARRLPGRRPARRSRTATRVLVCAPTGAGKTVVGEFAVHLALAAGQKCFYTTPIKALSNQKYNDLVDRYGADAGRAAHRRQRGQRRRADRGHDHRGPAQHALRRQRRARRARLRRHGRGALPRRPVPRRGVGGGDHPPARVGAAGVAVGDGQQRRGVRRVAGLGARRDAGDRARGAPGAAVAAHARRHRACSTCSPPTATSRRPPSTPSCCARRRPHPLPRPGARRGGGGAAGRAAGARRDRPDVIARLDREGLLPAITFIFSRAGCDAAVAPVRAGRAVADRRAEERAEIDAVVEERTADIPAEDLDVLGYWEWRDGAAPRRRRAPRRADPGVQGDRRGAVRARPGPGRVRHRDPRAGHQHAGPHRRARAADASSTARPTPTSRRGSTPS